MKILDLLTEAKFSSTIYAYHATPSENVRSILKNGLVANFKSGGYGSDETSDAGYSLTPLKGVYFTRDSDDAIEIAKHMNGIVVIAKLQPKQLELDEDRLMEILKERGFAFDIDEILEEMPTGELEISKILKMPEIKNRINEQIKRVVMQYDLTNFNENAQKHIVMHLREYLLDLVEFLIYEKFNVDDVPDETYLKRSQNVLTQLLRSLIHSDAGGHPRFKIDTRVGFSGANKIVGLYNFMTRLGWGDIGDLKDDAYHIVASPMKIFVTE